MIDLGQVRAGTWTKSASDESATPVLASINQNDKRTVVSRRAKPQEYEQPSNSSPTRVTVTDVIFLGNHKLTATAKVIVKICEHEVNICDPRHSLCSGDEFSATNSASVIFLSLQMNEIEICPECYLSACQKRDNWFCEPCVSRTRLFVL